MRTVLSLDVWFREDLTGEPASADHLVQPEHAALSFLDADIVTNINYQAHKAKHVPLDQAQYHAVALLRNGNRTLQVGL